MILRNKVTTSWLQSYIKIAWHLAVILHIVEHFLDILRILKTSQFFSLIITLSDAETNARVFDNSSFQANLNNYDSHPLPPYGILYER